MSTTAQVAKRANVSVQSIRNWSREYAELLTPAARGEAGPRVFADKDVEVLCAVAALRKSGVPRDEVMERLRSEDIPAVVDIEPQLAPQSPPQMTTEGQNTGAETVLVPHVVYINLQSRIEAL